MPLFRLFFLLLFTGLMASPGPGLAADAPPEVPFPGYSRVNNMKEAVARGLAPAPRSRFGGHVAVPVCMAPEGTAAAAAPPTVGYHSNVWALSPWGVVAGGASLLLFGVALGVWVQRRFTLL